MGPPRTKHCVEVGSSCPDCGPAFSSQTSQALMRRGSRLQAQISLPARLPGQAHRPRYSEGPAASHTKRAPPPRAGQPLVCGRSRAVGPGLRLGTSTAPDRFPLGPSARRLQSIPEVTSTGPGTRVPGCGKPQSGQGHANTIRTDRTPIETAPTAVPCASGSCPPSARPARAERVYPRDTWLPEPRVGGMATSVILHNSICMYN